jgi:Na+/H+ antiporter NhaD/arsenite permease-like protein
MYDALDVLSLLTMLFLAGVGMIFLERKVYPKLSGKLGDEYRAGMEVLKDVPLIKTPVFVIIPMVIGFSLVQYLEENLFWVFVVMIVSSALLSPYRTWYYGKKHLESNNKE